MSKRLIKTKKEKVIKIKLMERDSGNVIGIENDYIRLKE